MRVLVVEDEPLIGFLAEDLLESAGHAVRLAGSAEAALRLAEGQDFEVAVVDLGLPDATGAVLVKGLLAMQPGLRVVLSTGRRPDDPLVAAAMRAGGERIAALLGKPWPEGTLVEAVARAGAAPAALPQRSCSWVTDALRCLA